MKYVLPEKLANYLDFSNAPSKILIIESACYIKDMLSTFPEANICFSTSDPYKLRDMTEEYGAKIAYVPVAFNEDRLPFERYCFDIIIGDLLLEENFNPQDIASGLGSFLKPTGYLLTSFSNLLFKPWTDKLLTEERSEFIVRRGYTREDFERLMTASFFKEVFFEPLYETGQSCGEPPYYAVKAYASVLPVRNLKSLYDNKTRKELSILLHRAEYGVERENALKLLKGLIAKEHIFDDYLRDFIKEACFDVEKTLKLLEREGLL